MNKKHLDIMNEAPILIDEDKGFKLYRNKPYYSELVCSSDAYIIDKRTGENMGQRVFLFVHTFDDKGNDLPEEEWVYEDKDNYQLIIVEPEVEEIEDDKEIDYELIAKILGEMNNGD